MTGDCNHRNPLLRSGVNQYQRVLQALLPAHVNVDERDHADLILFAKNYADQLKYFNSGNIEDGDWRLFMSMDVSVTLASLAKINVEACFAYSKQIFDSIRNIDAASTSDLKGHIKVLFDFGFSITHILNEYYQKLPVDFEYRAALGNVIKSNLPQYLDRLTRYYDEAVNLGLIEITSTFTILPAPVTMIFSQNFDRSQLADIWTDASIPSFTPTFNGSGIGLQIKNTCTHNLFTGIFDNYLKILAGIVKTASGNLNTTLESFPKHAPHYALYLTFIKLFRYAQDHLNTFTTRHLDLYYKEILRLSNKIPEPDKVHLTFELSKTVQENHLVEKDTVFKAGKDIDGQEIFYALDEDVVLNKGVVRSLKSVFVRRDINSNSRQLFVSPVSNSEDGAGAKLLSPDKSWKTFGDSERASGTVGFVLASPYLYLLGGTRTIAFTFYPPAGQTISFAEDDIRHFNIALSGENGWVNVPLDAGNVSIHPSKEYFSITIRLDGGEPGIVPYTQKLHGHNFNTILPIARFVLNDGKAKDSVWDFVFERVGIAVNVTGMKDVVIQNDAGILSASKPFELFGVTPHSGSYFIIGSKEIFMKTLKPAGQVALKIHLSWDNTDDLQALVETDAGHTVDIYHLEDAVWKTTHTNVNLFDTTASIFSAEISGAATVAAFKATADTSPASEYFVPLSQTMNAFDESAFAGFAEAVGNLGVAGGFEIPRIYTGNRALSITVPALDVRADFSENESYTSKSSWGFLKLELNKPDFGHNTYASRLSEAALNAEITTTTDDGTSTTKVKMDEVKPPYTPKVKEVSIDYKVETIVDLTSPEEGAFIHVTPFGSKDISLNSEKTLLPSVAHEGELFVGLENFQTDQSISILFQIAEGTADPLAVKQDMSWHFLSRDNEWIPFEKENIVDASNDLTQSGIIRFNVSDRAVAENTLMTEQLYWLRATVDEKTNAVCKLVDVIAQAARAQFVDFKNSGNYFKGLLPSGSISKAVVSDASLKKISQPYASFGGRVLEADNHFYVRVSERLRHKNRAITMWDYERIVLEAFPSIFKVKCINHTQVIEKTSGTQTVYIDNEKKPGHVLIVPVPDLKNGNAFDPLRPYTSLGLMTTIKQQLYKCTQPHVNLDVRNPRFEEIQLEFKVKYTTGDNAFFTKQLKEELEQFMAPWAFDPATDIDFGGKISKSVLINFIEERSYVDFLSCVRMYQIVEGVKSTDTDEAVATSARSVFVSVKSDDPVNAHRISFITDQCEC